MKVKLNDTLHFADIRRDPFVKGDQVDLPERQAKDLIDRGLATAVASRGKAKNAGASSSNKAEGRSRSNKAAPSRIIGRIGR